MTFNHAFSGFDAQRMFLHFIVEPDLPLLRVSELIVPPKREGVIVVSIVRITFPIAGETNDVGRFFKAAVANQFGVQ